MTEHTPDWHCYNTGCREPGCREAWRTYAATHRRAQAYGRKPRLTMIDAAPVLDTVDNLIRGGISESTIARSARIGASTIWRARKAGRIRSDAAARISAFTTETADLLPRSRTDGTGTRRRLQALHAIGWTYSAIAAELDCTTQNVRSLVHSTESVHGLVTANTARRVTDLYERCWQAPPAPTNAFSAAEQDKAIRRARKNGWAVPAAWDDIDDPAETPGIVTHIDHTKKASTDTAEDVAFLLDLDPWATATQLGHRLGYTHQSGVQNALIRAGRHDLLAQLARNAQVAS